MAVYLFFRKNNISLTHRSELKKFIPQIFKKERKKLKDLTYVFCSDEQLLEINRNHLKHDFYTDIITFNLSEQPNEITGEVYISIDRVKENATLFANTIKEELLKVIFHGTLHLCGYNDKTKADSHIMRQKENFYVSAYLKNTGSTWKRGKK
jgi:probable rRNA maturation factor